MSLIFLILFIVIVPTQVNAAWQVTSFELYQGKPSKSENWREEEEGGSAPNLPQYLVEETENYLHAVASEYSRLGFADPVAEGYIDSVITREDGSKAIRIYYYPVLTEPRPYAWYSGGIPCASPATPRFVININSVQYARGGRIADMDYETLAHELFHAVQRSSEYAKKLECNGPNWISEGSADAIGIFMGRKLRNAKFTKEYAPGNSQLIKVAGGRDYSHPLHIPRSGAQHDYMTSSFWRYLAELDRASRDGKDHPGSSWSYPDEQNAASSNGPTPAGVPESYQYLADFFNKPWGVYPGPAGQLTWLNTRMKEHRHIRGSLSHLYPKFAAYVADLMAARISPRMGAGEGSEEREWKWLRQVFGHCNHVGAVGNGATAQFSLSVKPLAARCFKSVVIPGTPSKYVLITTMHDNKSILEQLQIGMPDGTDVRVPFIFSTTEEGQPPYIAVWHFPNYFKNDGTYIISNVAKNPALTKKVDLDFQVSTSNWEANMLNLPPARARQEPKPGNGKKRPTQKQKNHQAKQQVLAKPLEHLEPSARLLRDSKRDASRCDPLKLKLNLCGPQLKISLELKPLKTMISTMSLEAPAAGDIDFADTINQNMQAMVEFEEYLDGTDASSISIAIPLIDYGFTGSFSNAAIRVNKANEGYAYEAFGAPVQSGMHKIEKPPNGKVTITRYTPQVLEGTFSAGLVDTSLSRDTRSPVVARNISGRFHMPAPAFFDQESELMTAHLKDQMIESALQMAPFGSDVMQGLIENSGVSPQVLCENGFDDAQVRAMGFNNGCSNFTGGTIAQQCSCECNKRQEEEENPNCASHCSREWRRCPLPDDQITDDMALQIAQYKAHLATSNMPPEMQEALIETFKKMPDWQRKLTLQGFK